MLVFFGLFAGLLRTPMLNFPQVASFARFLFAAEGLTVPGAIIAFVGTFAIVAVVRATKPKQRVEALPTAQRRLVLGPLGLLVLALVLLFPLAMGPFFAQVIAIVALFVLLGLGLNITLGLAGLLDLGLRRLLRRRRLYGRSTDILGRVRDRRVELLAGDPIRGAVRDAVRTRPGPADPAHPGRLPGHRHPRLRRDHPHPGRVGPAQAVARRPARHPQRPQTDRRPADALPVRSGPDLLHRARLRGGGRLRGLAFAWVSSRPLVDGHPRGRGRRGRDGREPRPDQAAGLHAGRRVRGPGRRDLGGAGRVRLRLQHPAPALDQRGGDRHRRRHGQHPRGRRSARSC